jgi:hypothetical protein
MHTTFWLEDLNGKDHPEDLVVVDWILLAQERDQWRDLVNMVMNLRVQQNAGNFLTS